MAESPISSPTPEKNELPFYFSPPPGYETVLLEYPAPEEFMAIVNDYLQNLSSKKRDKALVDGTRYKLILQVLKDPRNTAISTAQFRFWVKKMFRLVTFDFIDFVCHDGKPVAIREDIYNILVVCHKEAHHGGRDKTSALVRKRYSWIPKELIARFVRHCPFCISRRNGCQSTIKNNNSFQYISTERNWNPNYYMAANVATSAAAAAVASSHFPNNKSSTNDESFEYYYSKPKDCCKEKVYPNHPYNMSFSSKSRSSSNYNTNTSAPSAAAAAVAVAAAAIAAVNLNQTPSSPSCSVSSTDSSEQKTPYSLVSYLSNDKSIDETMDTPYITSC